MLLLCWRTSPTFVHKIAGDSVTWTMVFIHILNNISIQVFISINNLFRSLHHSSVIFAGSLDIVSMSTYIHFENKKEKLQFEKVFI